MTIGARIILDNENPLGIRLTTLLLEYPRWIHSEFLTHRTLSRNCASSRAIPTEKLIERIIQKPAMPIHWGKNQKGMQAAEELGNDDAHNVRAMWLRTRDQVIHNVRAMMTFEPHKQVVNRLLEPWLHMQTVVTATDWDNFFALRDHPDAQPEIQALAKAIRKAMSESTPACLSEGTWHIPFIAAEEQVLDTETKLKLSTARCARTSYYFHDGKKSSIEQDIQLHDRLVGSEPRHSSPCEHQAQSQNDARPNRNFRGWKQYRVVLEAPKTEDPTDWSAA